MTNDSVFDKLPLGNCKSAASSSTVSIGACDIFFYFEIDLMLKNLMEFYGFALENLEYWAPLLACLHYVACHDTDYTLVSNKHCIYTLCQRHIYMYIHAWLTHSIFTTPHCAFCPKWGDFGESGISRIYLCSFLLQGVSHYSNRENVHIINKQY